MSLPSLTSFLTAHPSLRLAVLGARGNDAGLDLAPYGVPATFLPAEDHDDLALAYLALNRAAFPKVPLAAWVLSDVYVLPAGIALLLDGDAIAAAWVGLPSVRGDAVGVSLFSNVPGAGAGVKLLGARMLGVSRVRGVTQWSSAALRTHTRLGPLRVLGPVPAHELADSFVYETDLADDALVDDALARRHPLVASTFIAQDDARALADLVHRAADADDVVIAPPGCDSRRICVTFLRRE